MYLGKEVCYRFLFAACYHHLLVKMEKCKQYLSVLTCPWTAFSSAQCPEFLRVQQGTFNRHGRSQHQQRSYLKKGYTVKRKLYISQHTDIHSVLNL